MLAVVHRYYYYISIINFTEWNLYLILYVLPYELRMGNQSLLTGGLSFDRKGQTAAVGCSKSLSFLDLFAILTFIRKVMRSGLHIYGPTNFLHWLLLKHGFPTFDTDVFAFASSAEFARLFVKSRFGRNPGMPFKE